MGLKGKFKWKIKIAVAFITVKFTHTQLLKSPLAEGHFKVSLVGGCLNFK